MNFKTEQLGEELFKREQENLNNGGWIKENN